MTASPDPIVRTVEALVQRVVRLELDRSLIEANEQRISELAALIEALEARVYGLSGKRPTPFTPIVSPGSTAAGPIEPIADITCSPPLPPSPSRPPSPTA